MYLYAPIKTCLSSVSLIVQCHMANLAHTLHKEYTNCQLFVCTLYTQIHGTSLASVEVLLTIKVMHKSQNNGQPVGQLVWPSYEGVLHPLKNKWNHFLLHLKWDVQCAFCCVNLSVLCVCKMGEYELVFFSHKKNMSLEMIYYTIKTPNLLFFNDNTRRRGKCITSEEILRYSDNVSPFGVKHINKSSLYCLYLKAENVTKTSLYLNTNKRFNLRFAYWMMKTSLVIFDYDSLGISHHHCTVGCLPIICTKL
jgi:hypothetical protein